MVLLQPRMEHPEPTSSPPSISATHNPKPYLLCQAAVKDPL